MQKGSSVGGAVHLLAGGDHLAILDFFHNSAYLAAGHHGCRWQRRGAQGASGKTPCQTCLLACNTLNLPQCPVHKTE